MFTETEIAKMVFFDLETVPGFRTLGELQEANPELAKLWNKRAEYLESRFEENKGMTPEELYVDKAALSSEFNKIVCGSFGRISFEKDENGISTGVPKWSVKSFASPNEEVVLKGIDVVFNKFSTWKFCGHTVKNFDVPVMGKRLYINGFQLPKGLQVQTLKPWEMPFVDIAELWSFGAWKEGFTSLALMSTVLGIPSPKDDIEGKDVGRVFYEEKDLKRIVTYCEKDTLACAQIILKLSGLPIVEQ